MGNSGVTTQTYSVERSNQFKSKIKQSDNRDWPWTNEDERKGYFIPRLARKIGT